MDASSFLVEFVKAPTRTAAVLPSSTALAAKMVPPIPERGHPVVVELGAGSGALTRAIQQRLGGRGRHIALELNEKWANMLAERHPDVEVLCADARSLPEILDERGVLADVIVSGLPWAAYTPVEGGSVIRSLGRALSEDGIFAQFGYAWSRWAPPARRQLRDFEAEFEETATSRTIWRNVPPAVVHTARRPRRVRPH
ncbi:class I SAM-dependent methyltransferase [Parasphingorhabdus pacifica]